MGVLARKSGRAKFTRPSPPNVVPSSEKSGWFWLMGRSCPLHSAQPFGANTNDMILISDKNGSAILPSFHLSCKWLQSRQRAVAEAARGRNEQCAVSGGVEAIDISLYSRRAGGNHAVDPEGISGCNRTLFAHTDTLGSAAARTGIARDVQAHRRVGASRGRRPRIDPNTRPYTGERRRHDVVLDLEARCSVRVQGAGEDSVAVTRADLVVADRRREVGSVSGADGPVDPYRDASRGHDVVRHHDVIGDAASCRRHSEDGAGDPRSLEVGQRTARSTVTRDVEVALAAAPAVAARQRDSDGVRAHLVRGGLSRD